MCVCDTERMKTEMLKPEVRERIKYLSSDQFGVDEKKRPAAEDATQASFRKLNIDWCVNMLLMLLLISHAISRVGKNHDFFEKIKNIDLIDWIND